MRQKSYGGEKLRNLIKFLSVLGAVACTLIFVLIYFAQITIPEKVTIVEKTGYTMPKIFGFDLFNINSKTNLDVLRNNNEIVENEVETNITEINKSETKKGKTKTKKEKVEYLNKNLNIYIKYYYKGGKFYHFYNEIDLKTLVEINPNTTKTTLVSGVKS